MAGKTPDVDITISDESIPYNGGLLFRPKNSQINPTAIHFVKWFYESFKPKSLIDYDGELGEFSINSSQIPTISIWTDEQRMDSFVLSLINCLSFNIKPIHINDFKYPPQFDGVVHVGTTSSPVLLDLKQLGYPKVLFIGDHGKQFEDLGYQIIDVFGSDKGYRLAHNNINNLMNPKTISEHADLFDYHYSKGDHSQVATVAQKIIGNLSELEYDKINDILFKMSHSCWYGGQQELGRQALILLRDYKIPISRLILVARNRVVYGLELNSIEQAVIEIENKNYEIARELIEKDQHHYLYNALKMELLLNTALDRDEALQVCNKIIFDPLSESDVRTKCLDNIPKFLTQLSGGRRYPLESKLRKQYFNHCNPSIVRFRDRWYIILRSVNYTQKGACDWKISHEQFNDTIITTNYLLILDDNLVIEKDYEILEPEIVKNPPYNNRRLKGMEDMRIFVRDKQLRATFTLTNAHPPETGINTSIGEVVLENYNNQNCTVETRLITKHKSPHNRGTEKNWLPFEDGYIYGYDPMTIIDKNNNLKTLTSHFNLSSFRGSGGPCRYNQDQWLIVVHEVSFSREGDKTIRVYYHRFALLNDDFSPLKISNPFYFDHIGVEFCSGLASVDDDIYITYGVEDYTGELMIIPKKNIETMWISF